MIRLVFNATLLILGVSCLAASAVSAQPGPVSGAALGGSHKGQTDAAPGLSAASAAAGSAHGAVYWLARLRQAAYAPAYTGTYVVWSAPGTLASSRIWRASQGGLRVVRVDALSGQQRSTYRVTDQRGSDIETFLPDQRMLRIDRGDTPSEGGFPNLPEAGQGMSPADHYDARRTGQERVAGLMADVVQLAPRDGLRYGYKVWSEQRTGLAIKLQTLDGQGSVLEEAAFSELAFDAPINAAGLLRQRPATRGWQVQRVARAPTTAQAEGWQIGVPAGETVPGFALQHCYRQLVPAPAAGQPKGDLASGGSGAGQRDQTAQPDWFQCVFSDGLSAVSVFIEPDGAARHEKGRQGPLQAALGGATHLLERRVGQSGWVTAVGEVPPQTLQRFVAGVSPLR